MDDITATKLILDLESDLVEYVRSKIISKVKAGAKPNGRYRDGQIYKFGDDGEGFLALVHNGEVVYFVRHRRIRYAGFKLGRQVLLWRDPSNRNTITSGFARSVFFNILLPKYGALIADKEQTRNGSAFWANAIGNAFDRGLHVYCLDRRGKVTLTKLLNDEDLEEYSPVLWGNTPAHLYTFAVISQKPLALKDRTTRLTKEEI